MLRYLQNCVVSSQSNFVWVAYKYVCTIVHAWVEDITRLSPPDSLDSWSLHEPECRLVGRWASRIYPSQPYQLWGYRQVWRNQPLCGYYGFKLTFWGLHKTFAQGVFSMTVLQSNFKTYLPTTIQDALYSLVSLYLSRN